MKILSNIEGDENDLVVLDYQMSEAGKLEDTSTIFNKGSYNRNITVVYIVQNVLDKGKVQWTISLNSHYMLLVKNPRDEGQMRSLSQQVFHTKVKIFMDSFREAITNYHKYLHPLTLILEGRAHNFSALNYHSIRYGLTSVKICKKKMVLRLNIRCMLLRSWLVIA